MSEANKAVSRRVFEIFNSGDVDVFEEILAPGFVNHDPSAPPGLEGVKQQVLLYRGAFPDLEVRVEDQIAEGDRVVSRWSARGTHRGDLLGIAPTGKQGTATGITIDRLEGGKIVESWTNWDTLGLLQQLGAVPELARV
jgi:steroid delta-isomerase-like uncharacterized protein